MRPLQQLGDLGRVGPPPPHGSAAAAAGSAIVAAAVAVAAGLRLPLPDDDVGGPRVGRARVGAQVHGRQRHLCFPLFLHFFCYENGTPF